MTGGARLSWIGVVGISLLVASIVVTGQAPRTSQLNGSIVGRVVDSETGLPIRFADVQLSRIRGGGRRPVVTAEDGTFRFDDVVPGLYVMAAATAAYPPSYYTAEKQPVPEPGSPITVRQGEVTGPIEMRLIRGGVITGTVTDSYGNPPPPTSITVTRTPVTSTPGQSPFYFFYSLIYLDPQGRYRVFGLEPGNYLVSAKAYAEPWSDPASGRPQRNVPVYFPDTTDPTAAALVAVASGQEQSGVDLKLRTSVTFTVRGTASVPPEAKVETVLLRFQPLRPGGDSDFGFTSAGGPARQWIQSSVPPGHYTVIAHAQEPYQARAGRVWWATAPVVVTDQDLSGISLMLRSSVDLNGRVVLDDGTENVGLQWTIGLEFLPDDPPIVRYPSSEAGQITGTGTFSIRNIMPGRYRLKLLRAPTEVATIVSAMLGTRELRNAEIEITPEMTVLEPLTLRVRR